MLCLFHDPGAELQSRAEGRLHGEGLRKEIIWAATSLHSSFATFPVPTEMLAGRLVRKKGELGSIAPQGTQEIPSLEQLTYGIPGSVTGTAGNLCGTAHIRD